MHRMCSRIKWMSHEWRGLSWASSGVVWASCHQLHFFRLQAALNQEIKISCAQVFSIPLYFLNLWSRKRKSHSFKHSLTICKYITCTFHRSCFVVIERTVCRLLFLLCARRWTPTPHSKTNDTALLSTTSMVSTNGEWGSTIAKDGLQVSQRLMPWRSSYWLCLTPDVIPVRPACRPRMLTSWCHMSEAAYWSRKSGIIRVKPSSVPLDRLL